MASCRAAGMCCECSTGSRGDPGVTLQQWEFTSPSEKIKKNDCSSLCIYFCRATSCCLKEHSTSGYFCTPLFISLPRSWAGCLLRVECSLAFPSVAWIKQMFQFPSPRLMLPHAAFPAGGHQLWHAGPGRSPQGSLAPRCPHAGEDCC